MTSDYHHWHLHRGMGGSPLMVVAEIIYFQKYEIWGWKFLVWGIWRQNWNFEHS